MISTTLRTWNIQHNRFPCLFLYQNTPSGIFTISDVEAEIQEELSPLEKLILVLTEDMKKITRIEAYATSGISIKICGETLQDILTQGLIEYSEYDAKQLQNNLKRLKKELGDDWLTPQVEGLSKRKLLKQYQLSTKGKNALKNSKKVVREARNLNIVVTGHPFYLFYDQIDVRPDGFETLEMNRNLVGLVLEQAVKHADYTGIKPISIGSNSVIEGKEVSSTQFWVSVEGNGSMELESANYQAYLSSRSFDRWSNPNWNMYLENFLPKEKTIDNLVVKAISHTFMMVEEVIIEGLKLHEDRITWVLEVDLEMQMLIFDIMPEPIAETRSEVKLKLPNNDWNLVILLQLETYDDLADRSLKAGRFHQNSPRKGFALEDGFNLWKSLMEKWGKPVKKQEYLDTLEILTKYNCLIERLPKIEKVIVDVDDVLRKNRRGRQKWQLSRLREIEDLFEQAEIEESIFIASDKIYSKIDEGDNLDQWIAEEKIEVYSNNEEQDYPLLKAREEKCHYIGNKTMKTKDGKKEYSRTILFKVESKKLKIPGLEPFYDWRMENLFQKMYDVYYE